MVTPPMLWKNEALIGKDVDQYCRVKIITPMIARSSKEVSSRLYNEVSKKNFVAFKSDKIHSPRSRERLPANCHEVPKKIKGPSMEAFAS